MIPHEIYIFKYTDTKGVLKTKDLVAVKLMIWEQ